MPNTLCILRNEFFELKARAGEITSMRMDPSGTGRFGKNQVKAISFSFPRVGPHSERFDYLSTGYTLVGRGRILNSRQFIRGATLCITSTFESDSGRGKAKWELTLDGSRLKSRLTGDAMAGIQIQLPWIKSGYNVDDPERILFSAFYTERGQYLPIEQFKRITRLAYLDGCALKKNARKSRWIHAVGTGDWDWRFSAYSVPPYFEMVDDTMAIVFPKKKKGVSTFCVTLRPHTDSLPEYFPEFHTESGEWDASLNQFFYDRAFNTPSLYFNKVWTSAALCWVDSPWAREDKAMILEWGLDKEGWVQSWGRDYRGWPLETDAFEDTRHLSTNGLYVLSCCNYWWWHGDKAFLKSVLPRMRRTMDAWLDGMGGRKAALLIDERPDHQGLAGGYGNSYWDILPFGYKDGYANIYFYAALKALARVEKHMGNSKKAASLEAVARRVRKTYNATFWDEKKGRYIGCIDIKGTVHDLGFVYLNLEAMAYGLAAERQVKRIYHWLETEPTSTGKADTYSAWKFAPRATTIHNNTVWQGNPDTFKPWYAHFYPGNNYTGRAFGDQCEDGGAILYTSFYDIMARVEFLGADNAWNRYREILQRYNCPDKLCGGPLLYCGENPQHGIPGSVGTDIPFPESGLVPAAFLYAFLGVDAGPEGLTIQPRLPNEMKRAGVRKLYYHGLRYDIQVDSRTVSAQCTSKGHEREWTTKLKKSGRTILIGA